MSARVQFYCLVMRLDGLGAERFGNDCRLQDELNALVVAEARKLKPRMKLLRGTVKPSGSSGGKDHTKWYESHAILSKARKLIGPETDAELTWPFLTRQAWAHKWLDLQIEQAEGELRALAEKLPTLPGPSRYFDEVWTSTYSTVGFGAESYARAAADMKLVPVRHAGVEGEVLRVGDSFKVYVRVASKLDVEILKRKPPPPYAEQVRDCWARGCNPRVLNPWLPHGFEEKIGIDYFGKVVDREKFERACART